MSHSTECPCGRPRAGCEYHDPAPERMPPAELACAEEDFAREMHREAYNPYPAPPAADFRLLGPDDPEVSDDLIYLDEATGGVVGVPVTWEPTALAARRGRA